MTKILSFFLLFPSLVSDEIVYPLELTCEMGVNIYFISVDRNESWIETKNAIHNAKKNQNKRFQAKIEITESTIYVKAKNTGFDNIFIYINRSSLGAGNNLNLSGQCFKGFKKYSKQF